MAALDDEIGPAEMRRWLRRIEQGLNRLDAKVDGLPFVRTDVYERDRVLITAEIKEVAAETKEGREEFHSFRATLVRISGWAISGLTVLGGGAFALIHR